MPVSQRLLTGVVTRVNISLERGLNPSKIRDIVQVIDDSLLSDEIVDLCRWLADYYMAPLGSALVAALPPGVRLSSKRSASLTEAVQVEDGCVVNAPEWEQLSGEERAFIEELARSEPLKVSTLQHRLGRRGLEKRLTLLRRRGLIDVAPILEDRRTRSVSETHVHIVDRQESECALPALEKRARRQADCLRYLLENDGCARPALVRAGFSAAVIKGLEQRGLVNRELRERVRDPLAHIEQGEGVELAPTVDQERVIAALDESLCARAFHGALLHGVTGSGKTLVYMHLVRSALAQGRSAIVLVPEIALAWQMVRRFKQHFGDDVAVLHSQLSAGERYDTWKRLRRGEQRIVIGARSAVQPTARCRPADR